MNKYIVTFEWAGYDFCNTFHGENENDPTMRKCIIDWMGQCPDGGQIAEAFVNEEKEDIPVRNFTCYQIMENKINMGNILEEAWDIFTLQSEEWEKKLKEEQKQRELRELQYLKEKYEK